MRAFNLSRLSKLIYAFSIEHKAKDMPKEQSNRVEITAGISAFKRLIVTYRQRLTIKRIKNTFLKHILITNYDGARTFFYLQTVTIRHKWR